MLRKMLTGKITYIETIILCLQSRINILEEKIRELEKVNDSLKSNEVAFSPAIPLCESLDCVDDFHRLMDFDLLEPTA